MRIHKPIRRYTLPIAVHLLQLALSKGSWLKDNFGGTALCSFRHRIKRPTMHMVEASRIQGMNGYCFRFRGAHRGHRTFCNSGYDISQSK
eukprot:2308748-Karenia_brevis.AAC.1